MEQRLLVRARMRTLWLGYLAVFVSCTGEHLEPDDAGVSVIGDDAAVAGDDDGISRGSSGGDGSVPTALPDCPCFAGDGIYCGSAVVSYGKAHVCGAPNLLQHTGDLYRCSGGAWYLATSCGGAGCYVATGQADGCYVAGDTKKIFVEIGRAHV